MSADHKCFANRLCLQDVNPWNQPCFGFIIVQVYDYYYVTNNNSLPQKTQYIYISFNL